MAYIGRQPVTGNFVKLDSITVVNGQAAYTMNNGGSAFTAYDNVNQFLVSLNGILQAPTDSFTVSGSTLTFASNLATGDVIDFVIVLGDTLDIGTPSDNTVSLAKLTASGTKNSSTFLRGDNTFAEAGGGKLLQVVQAINSGSSVATSAGASTFVDTGLTANITPSASDSTIMCIITHPQARKINSDTQLYIKLLRDSTDIYVGIGSFDTSDSGRITDTLTFAKVDSPSTTSQITYKTQFASGNGIIYNGSNSPSTIILMEIGA